MLPTFRKFIFLLVFILLPPVAFSEPTKGELLDFYDYAYKHVSSVCPEISDKPEDTMSIVEFLQREDIGKILGIHSHDGSAARVFEADKELSAGLWVGFWTTMLGEERACGLINVILTKEPSLTEKLFKELGML